MIEEEDKRDFWVLRVEKVCYEKVCFDEPVTSDEAIELFNQEEFADILDSDEDTSFATGVV